MPNRACKWLAIVNSLATVVFACALCAASLWVPLRGSRAKVIALRRAGVIDYDKLRDFNPFLVKNPTYNLSRWVAGLERRTAQMIALLGILFGVCNSVMILLVWRGRGTRCAQGDGLSGD